MEIKTIQEENHRYFEKNLKEALNTNYAIINTGFVTGGLYGHDYWWAILILNKQWLLGWEVRAWDRTNSKGMEGNKSGRLT